MKQIFLVIFSLVNFLSFSQGVNDTSIFIPMLKFTYSYQIPGGDLAKRFGNNSNIAIEFSIKTKNNWVVGVEGFFLFGDKMKETSIFDSLYTSNKQLLNNDGEYSVFNLLERGFYIGATIGKLFPVFGPNLNSGVIVNAGAGLLQHKIKIENDANTTPYISGEYIKGYDRLSNGLATKIFIGYHYLGKTKLINFTAGFEIYQAWTKNRRDFNFDTRTKDNTIYKDALYSLKIGWILPFYVGKPEKFYTH